MIPQDPNSGTGSSGPASSLGAGSYAPEGSAGNTSSVSAAVPPLTIIPQTPLAQIVDAAQPFLPTVISPVVATLTDPAYASDADNSGGILNAGTGSFASPGGGLLPAQTDSGPATATSSGGFPTPATVSDITAGGNMTLPMIPGSTPGSTTVPAATTSGVFGTPFTLTQLLIAAAALLLFR